VTKDDKVYQFDRFVKQTYYSIAYTSDESMIEKFIEKSILFELCDKQVVDFRCSAIHTIARTIDGKIYVWGKNDGGILGNGFEDENIYEPKLNEYLKHLNITDMSCGVFHSLVLTSSGDIYSWGNNEFGQTGNGIKGGYQLKPYKMNFSVPEKFKAISCGTFHSMALSTSGRVYSCGFNFYGELGYGNNENLNKIKIIKMDNIIIEKISCGNSHSLMLSNEGDIYVSGCYETDGSEFRENQPLKLNNPNKFLDIKTLYNKKICAALSSNGFYYIWGKCEANDGIRLEPKETTYKSFNDIFIDFYQKTYEPIKGMINRFVDGLIQNKHYITLYKEKEKLGEGSYGVVFKANVKMNENFTFAVKKIKFNTKYEKEILKELEIHSLISRINHKNIVRFEEYWIENNDIKKSGVKTSTLFFRMELCDKTLDQFLEKFHTNSKFNGTLFKYYISSAIFVEILEGVNYLHKNEPQIIHRDLRPDNILMNLDENSNVSVKIADFGLVTIHKYAEQFFKA
jgi:tRNA A-37 threonylcarbamoyl transferase component Bud32